MKLLHIHNTYIGVLISAKMNVDVELVNIDRHGQIGHGQTLEVKPKKVCCVVRYRLRETKVCSRLLFAK